MDFMTKLKARREAIAKGQQITRDALAAKRSLTPAEGAEVDRALALLKELDADPEFRAQMLNLKADEELFAQLSAAGPVAGTKAPWERRPDAGLGVAAADGAKRFLRIDAKAAAVAPSGARGVKALLAEGSSASPKVLDGGIVAQGRPASSLLDVLPVIVSEEQGDGGSAVYSYLRQVLRTENAGPVAKGALKPTSLYGLTRIDSRLKVIAHVSEALDVYDLRDNAGLERFLQYEMAAGVAAAITRQVLSGDGEGENIQGLAAVSGIVTQPFAVDALVTIRKALTSLELMGAAAAAVVMHPTTWEGLELTRENGATGGFLLDSAPVDVAARRLWSTPVVAEAQVPLGTAWILGEGAVALRTDVSAVELSWGLVGDDFSHNQLRARAEIRADLEVVRPGAVVRAALTA